MNHKSAYRMFTVVLCLLLFLGIPLNSFAEASGVYALKETTKTLTVSLKVSENPPDGGGITKVVDWGGAQVGAKITGKYLSLYTWDMENSEWELAFPKISYKYGVNVRLAEYESEGNTFYALGLTHSLLAYGCLYNHSGNTLSLYDLEGVSYEGYYESDVYPRLFNKQITAISDAMIAEGKTIEPIVKPKKGSSGLIYNEGDITGQEEAYLLSQSVNRTYYQKYNSAESLEDIYSDLMQWQGSGADQIDSFHSQNWQMWWEDHDWADNYAEVLKAYLVVPESGYYVFWVSADERGALWLGESNDCVNLIAQVDQAVTQGSYDVYPCQKSEPVYLEKDQVYYMRALHVEQTGSDHFSVAWSKPGMSQDYPTEEVPTECLSAPSTGEIGVLPRTITVDTDPIIPYENLTDLISGIDIDQESVSLLKTASITSDSSRSAQASAMVEGEPLFPMYLSDFEYIEDQSLYHNTHTILGDLYVFTAQHIWPELSTITGLTPQEGWIYKLESASPQEFYSSTESRWYGVFEDGITAFPVITTQPESINAIVGESLILSCQVDAAIAYRWYKNSAFYSQNSSSVSIPSATQDDTGDYYCWSANRYGNIKSDLATVTIYSEGEPIITQRPKASDLVYGQRLAESTLSGGEAIYLGEPVSGSFDWTDSTIVPNSGLSSYEVLFHPSDSESYHSVSCNVSVITAKAHATITWPTASDITYGDSISSSELSGGSASFNGETVEGSFLWANSSLSPNAGTDSYTVIFTPESNNFSSETDQVNVITQKADVTMIWPTASGITFGDSLADSSLSGGSASFNGESVEGSFAWQDSTVSPNAGTKSYTVVFTPQSSNFNTLTHKVSVVTAKADPVVAWPTASSIYVGSSLSESTLSDGSATYQGNVLKGTFLWENPTITPHVGRRSYTVVFKPDNSNFNEQIRSTYVATLNDDGSMISDDSYSVILALENTGISISEGDKVAIRKFVSDGLENDWWDKMLGVYGLYGGTATSSAINWKNPGTYDVIWRGTLIHDDLGVRSTDFSGRGILDGLTYGPEGILDYSNIHISTYINKGNLPCKIIYHYKNIFWAGLIGDHSSSSWADSGAILSFNKATSRLCSHYSSTNYGYVTITTRDNSFFLSESNKNEQLLFQDGVMGASFRTDNLHTYNSLTTNNLVLLAGDLSNDKNYAQPSNDQHSFFSVGDALTKGQVASLNSSVQHLMQALGREEAKIDLHINWPIASGIYLGNSLTKSTLKKGYATFHGKIIPGTFSWVDNNLVPDLGWSSYEVIFSPSDSEHYNRVVNKVSVFVSGELIALSPEAENILLALHRKGVKVSDYDQNAIASFVSKGIEDGWWDKMIGVYGLYGNLKESTSINWKTPGIHDVIWSGTLLYDKLGVRSTDFTGRGELDSLTYGPEGVLDCWDIHLSTYICEGYLFYDRRAFWLGLTGDHSSSDWYSCGALLSCCSPWNGDFARAHFSKKNGLCDAYLSSRRKKFVVGQAHGNVQWIFVDGLAKENILVGSNHTYNSLTTNNLVLLAGDLSNDKNYAEPSNDQHGFFSVGYYLTEAEIVSFNRAVHKLMQALGRE